MTKKYSAFAVLATLSAASAAWAAPIVLNSSFELPSIGANNFVEGTSPTDWLQTASGTQTSGSSSGGGVVANGSAYHPPAAPDGTQALLLKNEGGVYQQLSGFTAGSMYSVSFELAGRSDCCGPAPIKVLVDGVPLTFSGGTVTTITPGASYQLYTSDPFVAGSTSPTLTFANQATSDLSDFVDTVSVAATPEPASLSLLGLGAFGLLARRRRA